LEAVTRRPGLHAGRKIELVGVCKALCLGCKRKKMSEVGELCAKNRVS
jgi:hypothetical protein